MRRYEFMFVVDPRVSDEDVANLAQEYKSMITANGSQITGEENLGRRKLPYPINKLNEGKYVLLHIRGEGGKIALPEVEQHMRQNDKILRYLTVRTDEDLKRASHRQPEATSAEADPAGERERVLGRLRRRFAHIPADVSLADELIAERRAESGHER